MQSPLAISANASDGLCAEELEETWTKLEEALTCQEAAKVDIL